ncbi:MAG TPA: signal recognition particle-docking protein FtsY [Aurantimonas coralicida]|uniref:Signal recognition particle receptor FtsY n=2 Tax=root TaxID=1 RepID=A0A9C9TGP8_9HYPH|nr:signal recognition particle-docking protein FtsY [Aurantimonas coralicida]HEU00467.1 signal recognition particle-docking protein FtsY [Aurantimonas coralicida]
MAEQKGFFRRIFSFGSDREEDRVPENGELPRPSDTEVGRAGSPDPDMHPEAAASSVADSEAGASVEDGGGITPLAEVAETRASSEAGDDTVTRQTDTAQKKSAEILLDRQEPQQAEFDSPDETVDFSWLEAPEPEEAIAESPDFSFLEEPILPEDESLPPVAGERRESSEAADAAAPVVGPASEADHLDGHVDGQGDDLPDEEADFSWLDQDLPADDEDDALDTAERIDPAFDEVPDDGADHPLPAPASQPAIARPPVDPNAGFRLREQAAPAAPTPEVPAPWLQRLRQGLSRSSNQLSGSIGSIFTKRRLDEETLQDFEDVLIQADLGVETALRITDRLSEGRFGREIASQEVRSILADEIEKTLAPVAIPLVLDLEKKPHVILVVGVNGTGKTTTIGKLTAKLSRAGLEVTLCAGDTFRAAAVEQLKIWGERTGSEVVAKQIGADAAGLAFEAYDRAVENDSDVLIIDTAGRLQNKTELMAELEKIIRVLGKREPDAPHTVLLTLDATTGQNALNQVDIFRSVAGVNGLVMTKLDGTARGGILVAIAAKHKLPVYFVGVGEGIDDLEPFKAKDFASAIAGTAPAAAP